MLAQAIVIVQKFALGLAGGDCSTCQVVERTEKYKGVAIPLKFRLDPSRPEARLIGMCSKSGKIEISGNY
jgi:hypothetical protein